MFGETRTKPWEYPRYMPDLSHNSALTISIVKVKKNLFIETLRFNQILWGLGREWIY